VIIIYTIFSQLSLPLAWQGAISSADVTFFFNGPLGEQLSQNVLDRSSQNFSDSYVDMGGHDQSDLVS